MQFNHSGYRAKVVKLATAKKRKPSSNKWLKRQLNDCYTSQSKIDGYRSRSAYKLLEINDKFHIFKPGDRVIDLGAAPGGWSQVAAKLIKAEKNKNPIIALDLLEIEPIDNVIIITADFLQAETESVVLKSFQHLNCPAELVSASQQDLTRSGNKFGMTKSVQGDEVSYQVDVVMSDMAANTTGHSTTDHLRTMLLCEQAFEFSLKFLKPGGHFIAKIFQGGAENELLRKIKKHFKVVKHFKPAASRKESSEFYLIALNKKSEPLC